MSPAQLESETEQLRREVVRLKQEFRVEREKLDRLATAYHDSKKLNPAQRYAALKDMIKDATTTTTNSAACVWNLLLLKRDKAAVNLAAIAAHAMTDILKDSLHF